MDSQTIEYTLQQLGIKDIQDKLSNLSDGATALLHSKAGSKIAVIRRGARYDALVVGTDTDCPVPALRAVLETAVLPLSDDYAANVGVAVPERDAVRRRIREASVALDVIAKGRLFSVALPDIPLHVEIKKLVEAGANSVDDLPDGFVDSLPILNQLQANVVSWSKEIDRVVQISQDGPGALLSIEEETVFWSSLDAALASAQKNLSTRVVKLSLEILARRRRATGFLIDVTNSLDTARRKAAGVLTLIQGLPIVAIRTAEDLPSLKNAAVKLLDHVAAKLRISSFSVERVLSLVDAMGREVCESIGRIMTAQVGILTLPFPEFMGIFGSCCNLFEEWSLGFDHCRKAAREAARKRGETMPARSKSPLSRLHKHLFDVYEVRSDHQAIREVLLQLSATDSAATRRIELLDSTYATLVNNNSSLNHFELSSSEENTWFTNCSNYKKQMKRVDEKVAEDYLAIIKTETDLQSLANCIRPFECVLEKQFMAQATADAIPSILALGSQALKSIRNREHVLNRREPGSCPGELPHIGIILSESCLLRSRLNVLLQNMEQICGKTHLDATPDLREFVSELEELRHRLDLRSRFTSWLTSVDFNCYKLPLFSILRRGSKRREIVLTIGADEASFFKVIRLSKEINELHSCLSKTILDFSRVSKSIFHVYTGLKEAIEVFSKVTQGLMDMDAVATRRIFPFIQEAQLRVQNLIEEGFRKRWDDDLVTLKSYMEELRQSSVNLHYNFQIIDQSDKTMTIASERISILYPKHSEEGLCIDTTKLLEKMFGKFVIERTTLSHFFPELTVNTYFCEYWDQRIKKLLWLLLEKFTKEWMYSSEGKGTDNIKVELDITQTASGHSALICYPNFLEVEIRLYGSLIGSYKALTKASAPCFKCIPSNDSGYPLRSEEILAKFLSTYQDQYSDMNMLSPFYYIHQTIDDLISSTSDWNEHIGLVTFNISNIDKIDNTTANNLDILHVVAKKHEDIALLIERDKKQGGNVKGDVRIDSSSLGKRLLSITNTILEKLSASYAISAADESQWLYKMISESHEMLRNVNTKDGMKLLAFIQVLEEEKLPKCTSHLHKLQDIEQFFENIATRFPDCALPRAIDIETWILSESIEAQLSSLKTARAQRAKAIEVNESTFRDRYNKMREEYQLKVSSLFTDFQNIRDDTKQYESFIEMELLLQDLEHQLRLMDTQGVELSRVGRALRVTNVPEVNGPQEILVELGKVRQGLEQLGKVEEALKRLSSITFRDLSMTNVVDELSEIITETERIANSTGARKEAMELKEIVSNYRKGSSLLRKLRSVTISPPRQRDLIQTLFAQSSPSGSIFDTTLSMFWKANLQTHEKYLNTVLENAAGEASICEFLGTIDRTWIGRKVSFLVHEGTPLIQNIPILVDELEEHLHGLETMKGSPYAPLFESERSSWENRLAKLREDLNLLIDVQSRWAHLRALFGAREGSMSGLRNDLQKEFALFSSVHVRFNSLLVHVERSPGILESFDGPLGLSEMSEEMQGIVRSLSSFLEKQRAQFPRFFFLSDNDLLHVLSTSSEMVDDVMPYIHKMFPGVASLQIEKDNSRAHIHGILSKEREEITFDEPVIISPNGKAVNWLQKMERVIQLSQKKVLLEGIQRTDELYSKQFDTSDADFIASIGKIPAQMLLLAIKLKFTSAVDEVLKSAVTCKIDLQILIADVELILSQVIEWRHAASNSSRIYLLRDQLIKELVRQQDMLDTLVREECHPSRQAYWSQELRFYKVPTDSNSSTYNVTACCGDGSFSYGWEYLGMGETLVNTRLTSRCFLILCEALRRGYGGSPFGPAGTGKTETVKALGRILGRFVAVFNCDESFDSVSVGRILAGASRIGCWVCFDEFNRLSSSSLSSTSGHLATLQSAIRKKEKQVTNFYGGDISITIQDGVGIFVTMNPTYSGRRDLPANLKSLFRPCSMAKPDTLAITEVLLRSNGFLFAPVLAQKLVSLFRTLKISLSDQPHYDFGLRALKSTVTACGKILMDKTNAKNGESQEQAEEETVLIQGMSVILKPKLWQQDIRTYDHAVNVVFDQATASSSLLPKDLTHALGHVIKEKEIADSPYFREKLSQLYSLLQYQSGVILVGETGSGKSTVCNVLFEAVKKLYARTGENVEREGAHNKRATITRIDPKLLSTKELYGNLDPLTREWTDGLFTRTIRGLAEERSTFDFPLHWIIFDGDIDPDWVENLNSVLDDNKILTLPNGEQVPLMSHTRILFETDNLAHANPSTISRCGMLCFSNGEMKQANMISSVKLVLKEFEIEKPYDRLLNRISKAILDVLEDKAIITKLIMSLPFHSMMESFITLCRFYCNKLTLQEIVNEDETLNSEKIKSMKCLSVIELARLLLVSATKSFGAGLTKMGQREFAKSILDSTKTCDEVQTALNNVVVPHSFAEVELTREYEFQEYSEMLPDSCVEEDRPNSVDADIVIATPSTLRLESLLSKLLCLEEKSFVRTRTVILCGPPGCGKSMILMTSLRNIPNVVVATLSFSSETSPGDILTALKCQTTISKRSNGSFVLHPKAPGYRVVLFCDEVNLQTPDSYGTQSSICFLRNLAEHNGFWDGSAKHWVSLEGIQVVAACNPPEDAGRHEMSPRFLRHCAVIHVEQPDEDDLRIIYNVFVRALLRPFGKELLSKSGYITNAMVEFFSRNKERFSPVSSGPLRPHYVYSPRELSRWIRGMKRILLSGTEEPNFSQGSIIVDNSQHHDWERIVSVFCYEARRLFRDRLLTPGERQFAEQVLLEVVRKYLQPDCNIVQESLFTSWLQRATEEGVSEFSFEIVADPQRFRDLVYQKLRVFAEEEGLGGSWTSGSGAASLDDATAMIDQFAVTDDVLTHLTRIERILSQPLGHAVLVGAPGTGKKTLARFSAWMLSIEIHQVHSHMSYTEEDFANDLRRILRRAGVDGRQVMMIFDESNVLDSSFLEMMNSVLACGEVPGLFSGDELSNLLEDLKNVESQSVFSGGGDQALYSEFVNRVRRNLHVVFTMSTHQHVASPQAPDFQRRSKSEDISTRSPALYNRCTVDWIGDWNRETLEAVADLKIEASKGQEKDQLIRCAVEMHEIVKQQYASLRFEMEVTPRHYLEFIEQLNRLALEKGKEIEAGVDRHKEGLHRLRSAGEALDNLRNALRKKSEKLQVKERNANHMLAKMMEEQRMAEKSKVEAEQLAFAAAEASAAVREREEQVAAQIAEVQPKIETARVAVGSIRKEFLEELRAMPNPPSGVRIALEGVLMVLDGNTPRADTQLTWSNIRTRMRGSDFISNVVHFDAQSLPKGIRSKIERRVLRNPDFDVVRISYASRAAGPLAEWTLAVLDYITVKEGTEPLQQEVEELQEEQQELLERQESALVEVNSFNARIEECRTEYARLVSEAERVRQDIQESQTNLQRSEEMLDSLASEWDRWISDLNKFNAAAVTVWGNAILGAAFIAYLGVLDHVRRGNIVSLWKTTMRKEGVAFDEDMQICNFLTSTKERGIWATRGLSADSTSIENYAILKRSARYPLIVDPTRHSSSMLQEVLVGELDTDIDPSKNNESANLRISESSFTTTGKRSYMRALESAMRFGTSLIITDADKFDRAVAPLLGQETSYGDTAKYIESLRNGQGRKEGDNVRVPRNNMCQRMIRLGDRDVVLSPRFRLFLSTTDISAVPSSAVTRTNVVSFEMSPAALGAKCVSESINILAPHIEAKRRLNLTAKVKIEERKRELEEEVLTAVNNVEDLGAELLHGPLLQTLSRLKGEVKEIESRQKEEETASEEMKLIENKFSRLGSLAVDIFGVLQNLQLLNPIYIFKSSFFLRVFKRAISGCNSHSESIDDTMLDQCQKGLLVYTYRQVVTNLFPPDRLSFAASLALISHSTTNMGSLNEDKSVVEVQEALRRAFKNSTQSQQHNVEAIDTDCLEHLSPSVREKIRPEFLQSSLTDLSSKSETCVQLLCAFLFDRCRVSDTIDHLACTLPGQRKLVHGEITRPEEALRAVIHQFGYAKKQKEGHPQRQFSPILLCARGENSNPTSFVLEFANDSNIAVISIAMGASVAGNTITESINAAAKRTLSGKPIIVLLKNMHLATRSTINIFHSEISRTKGKLDCLVIVAAEVSKSFTAADLVGAAPIFRVFAFESPPTFRANLSSATKRLSVFRSNTASAEQLDAHHLSDSFQILLAWLHASLLERAYHSPLGFSQSYEFAEGDLVAAWESFTKSFHSGKDYQFCITKMMNLLASTVYGCRVELEDDQEIIVAMVDLILCRHKPENSRTVIINNSVGKVPIVIPLSSQEQMDFISTLPVGAKPEWSYLPTSANRRREAKEGVLNLEKVLLLSRRKFQNNGRDDYTTTDQVSESKDNFDYLIRRGLNMPDVTEDFSQEFYDSIGSESLQNFVITESTILCDYVGHIKSDLSALVSENTSGTKEPQQIIQLRRELHNICVSESRNLPTSWKHMLTFFREVESVGGLFDNFRNSLDTIKALQRSKRNVMIQYILRPAAFFEALKYEAASKSKVSPHSLKPYLSGNDDGDKYATSLSHVWMSGAKWNAVKKVFSLSSDDTGSYESVQLTWRGAEPAGAILDTSQLDVPLYTRGSKRELIFYVKIPISPETSAQEWRLNGSYFAV